MNDRKKVIKELRLIHGWFKKMKLCHPEKAEMYDNAKSTIADAIALLKEQEERCEQCAYKLYSAKEIEKNSNLNELWKPKD